MDRGSPAIRPEALSLAAIAALLALQAPLVLSLNINWDEFASLSRVYDLFESRRDPGLQTAFLYLFGWLRHVGEFEFQQVFAARSVLFAGHMATCTLLFLALKRLCGTLPAAVATIAFAAHSYVMLHGFSFRHDPVATLLGATTAFALTRPAPSGRARAPLVAALLALGSLLVTPKALVFFPLLGVLALRGGDFRRALPSVLAFLGLALVTLAAFQVLDTGLLGAGSRMIDAGRLFPRAAYWAETVVHDAAYWLVLFVAGAILVARWAVRKASVEQAAVFAAGLAPLVLALAFYRNSFPYFYVMLLFPAAFSMGVALSVLFDSLDRVRVWGLLLACVLAAEGTVHAARHWSSANQLQQQLIRKVHAAFPEPVPYLDRTGMIASFPRRGFFMSTLGMQRYRERGEPVLAEAVERGTPLLIANSPFLALPLVGRDAELAPAYRLLPADRAALVSNYVQLWEHLFVAGKVLPPDPECREPADIDIHVSGPYRLLSAAEIAIDGTALAPGQSRYLARGRYRLSPCPADAAVVLSLVPPGTIDRDEKPAPGPLYRNF